MTQTIPLIPAEAGYPFNSLSAPSDLMQCAFEVEGPAFDGSLFATDAARVRHMRTIVAARLRYQGLDELLDPVRLIVSELVTNAVQHGGKAVALSLLTTSAEVRLSVRDGGRGRPRAVAQDADAESGRGVWIVGLVVAELGGTWGYALDSRTAWCVLPLTGSPRTEQAALHPHLPAPGGITVSETDPHDLREPTNPPLPDRPAGQAWSRAKAALPLPEFEAVALDPEERRTPEEARARWSGLSRRRVGRSAPDA
ncbi:ATP-binding protein [Streptomyces erythrochromogenes]|uniref:ATP-binding protein n=1 Tax=Streptomyces erythrochromogenes TaxID=285574 RepID=UPI003867F527|nr:ATP-binding protein [Streptomyces erythrochromogenes]WSR88299.1 ATP-binding protein [Streptomyces erythrochromogenes]